MPKPVVKDRPLSNDEIARFVRIFDSDDGTIEAFAHDSQLWGKPAGSSGEGSHMRYQAQEFFHWAKSRSCASGRPKAKRSGGWDMKAAFFLEQRAAFGRKMR